MVESDTDMSASISAMRVEAADATSTERRVVLNDFVGVADKEGVVDGGVLGVRRRSSTARVWAWQRLSRSPALVKRRVEDGDARDETAALSDSAPSSLVGGVDAVGFASAFIVAVAVAVAAGTTATADTAAGVTAVVVATFSVAVVDDDDGGVTATAATTAGAADAGIAVAAVAACGVDVGTSCSISDADIIDGVAEVDAEGIHAACGAAEAVAVGAGVAARRNRGSLLSDVKLDSMGRVNTTGTEEGAGDVGEVVSDGDGDMCC